MPTVKTYFDDNYIPLFKNMLYSAILYKEDTTSFDLVIGIEQKNQTGGLTLEGQDSVLSFCRMIGVSVVFEELISSNEIFTSLDFRSNFSTMPHIPYDSLVARLKMMLNAREDFYYFDVDLIMQEGWDRIFSIEPQNTGTVIMASKNSHRRDLDLRADFEHPQHWVMSDKSNKDHYFNAGIIKFISKSWDEGEFNDKLLSLLTKIEKSEIICQFADQDILNHLARNNFELLDQTFNVMVHTWGGDPVNNYYSVEKKHHPKILHYVGGDKLHKIGVDRKDQIIHLLDSNCEMGFVDHAQNYFYTYFFIQNQRKLFERSVL
jgi:lipopolysaccharide biosynthesis glycosyltransferase